MNSDEGLRAGHKGNGGSWPLLVAQTAKTPPECGRGGVQSWVGKTPLEKEAEGVDLTEWSR